MLQITVPLHCQCQPMFPELFSFADKPSEKFLRGFCDQKDLGNTAHHLFSVESHSAHYEVNASENSCGKVSLSP